ncbi:unnamed protein product [Bathycoccus prasinos]|mmetsp:Transcript_7021/g.23279  ORF Transcript_7021/g.23279 Transcript_7021/m.23279 type:complete len:207 (+) Transcript_7021:62-682(+)
MTTTTKMETTEEEEATKNTSFSRVNELHSMFEDSLTTCFEVKTIGEFAAHFPTLPKEYHVPLYDLYSQLYASIKEKSREEFEQILKEESLEIKLKAIDDACVARGIDMNARVNSIEAIAEDMVSKVVAPEEAARAARADAKRRELILLEEECEKERVVEEEHVRILEEKRREVQMAAGRVGRAQNELEEVRDASLQWAGRQAYVSR